MVIKTVQYLWALPLTLFGFCLALCTGIFDRKQRFIVIKNAQTAIVFIVYGAILQALLKRHPFGNMQAVSVGCCILAQDADCARSSLVHELVHVQQALRWGLLFPIAYLLASLWAWARGGHMYRDNRFEVAAYAAQDNAMDNAIDNVANNQAPQ